MRKEKEGRESAFEVYSHATFGHALGIFHDFEVFGVVGVARQGVDVVDCHGEYAVIRGGSAKHIDAVFERMELGHDTHEGFEVFFHPSGMFEGCFSVDAVFVAPHYDMFEHEVACKYKK